MKLHSTTSRKAKWLMTQPHALNQPSMHKKLLRPVQFPKIMAHHFRALREWHLSATPFEAVNQTNSYTRKFMHCRVQHKKGLRGHQKLHFGDAAPAGKKTQRASKTKTFPARIFFHLISHINSAVCKASAKTAYEQQQKKVHFHSIPTCTFMPPSCHPLHRSLGCICKMHIKKSIEHASTIFALPGSDDAIFASNSRADYFSILPRMGFCALHINFSTTHVRHPADGHHTPPHNAALISSSLGNIKNCSRKMSKQFLLFSRLFRSDWCAQVSGVTLHRPIVNRNSFNWLLFDKPLAEECFSAKVPSRSIADSAHSFILIPSWADFKGLCLLHSLLSSIDGFSREAPGMNAKRKKWKTRNFRFE